MAFGNVVEVVIKAKDDFSRTFSSFGKSLSSARGSIMAFAAAGAILAVGMKKVIDVSNKVETGFAKVNTLLDEGQKAQELYGDFVSKTNVLMGNQGDQIDVLSGLYQTISAGITDTAEAQIFMTAATKSAVGGSAELSTVITAGTKAMAAFGIDVSESEKVFDIFAATVKAGQTTMGQLAGAFPRVSGVAAEMGMTLEETGGIFAGLTKVMKDPEEVATSLTAILTGLLKPSTDMEDAFKMLGYESGQAMVEELGLMGTLEQLKTITGDDAEAMGNLFGNVRALRGVMPALGSAAEDVADSIDIVSDSVGLSQKQFEDMAETTEYQWGQAMSEVQNLQKDLGDSLKETLLPILDKLIIVIEWLSNTWNKLSPGMKEAVVVLGLVTVAVAALAAVILALTMVSLPWLLIIGAVIVAITAIILLIMHWKEVTDWLRGILIKFAVGIMFIFQKLKNVWEVVWAHIKNIFISAWNFMVNLAYKGVSKMIDMIEPLIRAFNKISGVFGGPTIDISELKKGLELGKEMLTKDKIDIGALKAKQQEELATFKQELQIAADTLIAKTNQYEEPKKEVNVNIENLYGTDPEEIDKAMSEVLNTKGSL